ncbi:hypothetical protein BDZ97DRAFT_2055379 [Flammula alnicola]|nr:hypothetical protein BDZ97DRAFT_2055379 [Flammula alnicola]
MASLTTHPHFIKDNIRWSTGSLNCMKYDEGKGYLHRPRYTSNPKWRETRVKQQGNQISRPENRLQQQQDANYLVGAQKPMQIKKTCIYIIGYSKITYIPRPNLNAVGPLPQLRQQIISRCMEHIHRRGVQGGRRNARHDQCWVAGRFAKVKWNFRKWKNSTRVGIDDLLLQGERDMRYAQLEG